MSVPKFVVPKLNLQSEQTPSGKVTLIRQGRSPNKLKQLKEQTTRANEKEKEEEKDQEQKKLDEKPVLKFQLEAISPTNDANVEMTFDELNEY